MKWAVRQTAGLSEELTSKTEDESSSNIWRLLTEVWALVTPAGEKLRLTGKEYAFIHKLVETPSATVFRTILLKELSYPLDEHAHRSLESLNYRLRKKISPLLDTPIQTLNSDGSMVTSRIDVVT